MSATILSSSASVSSAKEKVVGVVGRGSVRSRASWTRAQPPPARTRSAASVALPQSASTGHVALPQSASTGISTGIPPLTDVTGLPPPAAGVPPRLGQQASAKGVGKAGAGLNRLGSKASVGRNLRSNQSTDFAQLGGGGSLVPHRGPMSEKTTQEREAAKAAVVDKPKQAPRKRIDDDGRYIIRFELKWFDQYRDLMDWMRWYQPKKPLEKGPNAGSEDRIIQIFWDDREGHPGIGRIYEDLHGIDPVTRLPNKDKPEMCKMRGGCAEFNARVNAWFQAIKTLYQRNDSELYLIDLAYELSEDLMHYSKKIYDGDLLRIKTEMEEKRKLGILLRSSSSLAYQGSTTSLPGTGLPTGTTSTIPGAVTNGAGMPGTTGIAGINGLPGTNGMTNGLPPPMASPVPGALTGIPGMPQHLGQAGRGLQQGKGHMDLQQPGMLPTGMQQPGMQPEAGMYPMAGQYQVGGATASTNAASKAAASSEVPKKIPRRKKHDSSSSEKDSAVSRKSMKKAPAPKKAPASKAVSEDGGSAVSRAKDGSSTASRAKKKAEPKEKPAPYHYKGSASTMFTDKQKLKRKNLQATPAAGDRSEDNSSALSGLQRRNLRSSTMMWPGGKPLAARFPHGKGGITEHQREEAIRRFKDLDRGQRDVLMEFLRPFLPAAYDEENVQLELWDLQPHIQKTFCKKVKQMHKQVRPENYKKAPADSKKKKTGTYANGTVISSDEEDNSQDSDEEDNSQDEEDNSHSRRRKRRRDDSDDEDAEDITSKFKRTRKNTKRTKNDIQPGAINIAGARNNMNNIVNGTNGIGTGMGSGMGGGNTVFPANTPGQGMFGGNINTPMLNTPASMMGLSNPASMQNPMGNAGQMQNKGVSPGKQSKARYDAQGNLIKMEQEPKKKFAPFEPIFNDSNLENAAMFNDLNSGSNGGMFGNHDQNAGMFGANQAANNGDMFGNSNAAGGMFGDSNANMFGDTNANNSMFGGSSDNVFGGTNSNMFGESSGGMFGNTDPNSGGMFGNHNNSMFTDPNGGMFSANPDVGMFGANPGGGMFGTNQDGGMFGTNQNANVGMFGNQDQNVMFGNLGNQDQGGMVGGTDALNDQNIQSFNNQELEDVMGAFDEESLDGAE